MASGSAQSRAAFSNSAENLAIGSSIGMTQTTATVRTAGLSLRLRQCACLHPIDVYLHVQRRLVLVAVDRREEILLWRQIPAGSGRQAAAESRRNVSSFSTTAAESA